MHEFIFHEISLAKKKQSRIIWFVQIIKKIEKFVRLATLATRQI